MQATEPYTSLRAPTISAAVQRQAVQESLDFDETNYCGRMVRIERARVR